MSDSAAHSGSCRYGTLTYPHTITYLEGPEHITGWKRLFMHLVHFDLSALLSVAIHPIQFIFYHFNLHSSQEAMIYVKKWQT